MLTRAIRTADLALAAAGQLWIPMDKDWRLNERHYGGLTGLNKAETAGQARRRAGDGLAPLLRHPAAAAGARRRLTTSPHDRRYAGVDVPGTESLKTTLERVRPYWEGEIAPRLAAGERLLIAAHGNSLRAIVKLLFDVSDAGDRRASRSRPATRC